MASGSNEPRPVGTMWTLSRDEPAADLQPLVDVRFRKTGPQDMPALAEAMGSGSAEEIQKRFAGRRRCYAAWAGEQVAAYGWSSFEEEYIGELGLRLQLLPGEAYIWDCATIPAFQQKRLFVVLLSYMVNELRAEGVQRVWIGANLENEASQRGIDRAGFRRVADLLVKPGEAARHGWLEGYPGVDEELLGKAQRLLLGDAHAARVG